MGCLARKLERRRGGGVTRVVEGGYQRGWIVKWRLGLEIIDISEG